MNDPILEVRNLHVHFDTYEGTAEVINGVDFTLDEGETAALVGETGCGKSVTVKSIMGLVPGATIPEGEILYKGENVLDLSDAERHARRGREMSMIMQDPMTSLNPVLTVGEQMVDVLKWQGRPRLGVTSWVRDKLTGGNDAEHRERAIEMLSDVEISAPERVFESYPVELSGGMRQRVLIAIALACRPKLLVADEPTTALDVTVQARILRLLDDLKAEYGMGVLFITHDLGVVSEIADRIVVLYAGKVMERGDPLDIFERPAHPYTRRLLACLPGVGSDHGGIPGSLPDPTDPLDGCRFAPRCEHAVESCSRGDQPAEIEVGPDHWVSCIHYHEGYDESVLSAEGALGAATDGESERGGSDD